MNDDQAQAAHDAAELARFERECGVTIVTGPEHDPYATSCEADSGHGGPHAGMDPFGAGTVWLWTGGGSVEGDRLPMRRAGTLVPREDRGAFFEEGDPGTVGRLHCPMNEDGTPDLANVGEIEVSYEDA